MGRSSTPSKSPQGQVIQLKGEVISMCQNVYGCRVVQRLLMYADEDTKATIIKAVLGDVVANAVDTYSNYVIQHILVHGPADAKSVHLLTAAWCCLPSLTRLKIRIVFDVK